MDRTDLEMFQLGGINPENSKVLFLPIQELFGRPLVGGGLQKRPFCNAFTGCAGKRTSFTLPLGDRQRLRFFRKFNAIDAPVSICVIRGFGCDRKSEALSMVH